MHKIHQSSIAKEMHSFKTFKLRTLKMCALNYTGNSGCDKTRNISKF